MATRLWIVFQVIWYFIEINCHTLIQNNGRFYFIAWALYDIALIYIKIFFLNKLIVAEVEILVVDLLRLPFSWQNHLSTVIKF